MNTTESSNREEVIKNEFAWHEREAQRRYRLDALLYKPPAFDVVVRTALRFLDGDRGESVLEIGCGEGKETSVLASFGLRVIAIDLSFTQISRARELLQVKGQNAQVRFVQASAEATPFATNTFHLVYGKAILHHLDLDISSREVGRLLKPGGRGTFAEPLANHPLIWLGRRLTPRLRTKNEHPLALDELERFAGTFRVEEIETHFLIATFAYLLRVVPAWERVFQKVHSLLAKFDQALFQRFPATRKYAWYGLVKFHQKQSSERRDP